MCLQLFKHKKLWRIIKFVCPCLVLWSTLWCLDYGTGNKRLICNLLSQHRWWSILHFAFMLTWCFKKRLPVCVNAAYSSLWTLVFAFWLCTKIVPNLWTFSAPSVCTFYRGWNVTESFSESLHFVIVGLCSWGSDSRLRNPMKISLQGQAMAPLYNS